MTEMCPALATWVQEQDGEGCRPCSLAVLVAEYQKILNESGESSKSRRIAEALTGSDPILKVAEEMDKIKVEVNSEVREALQNLDCYAQETAEKEG